MRPCLAPGAAPWYWRTAHGLLWLRPAGAEAIGCLSSVAVPSQRLCSSLRYRRRCFWLCPANVSAKRLHFCWHLARHLSIWAGARTCCSVQWLRPCQPPEGLGSSGCVGVQCVLAHDAVSKACGAGHEADCMPLPHYLGLELGQGFHDLGEWRDAKRNYSGERSLPLTWNVQSTEQSRLF